MREFSLSGTQEGIYIECMNNPESTLYNIPSLYKLPKDIDVERFIKCFKTAVEHNTGMSTRIYTMENGAVMQRVSDEAAEVGIVHTSEAEFKELSKTLHTKYDLNGGKLWRAVMYMTEENNWFYFDIHHIIIDGTSLMVMNRQMRTLYDGGELSEVSNDGIYVAQTESELVNTSEYKDAQNYFNTMLDGMECDCAPIADIEGEAPKQCRLHVNSGIEIGTIASFCREHGVSRTAFFTAVMGFVIAKYNFKNNSVISTVYNGRNRDDFRNAVTMLVKTLPFVTDMEKNTTVSELLTASMEQLAMSRKYSFYPFSQIASDSGMTSDINFAYQGKILDLTMLEGVPMQGRILEDEAAIEQSKMILEVCETVTDEFEIRLRYRGDVYSEGLAAAFVRSYIKTVEEFVSKESLDDISIISETDEQAVYGFNKTERDADRDITVADLIREQIKANPDNTAIVCRDKRITYKELDEISEGLACEIAGKGLKAEDVIAILIPRDEYMAIAPLGVIKAGCAYQPLDPSYPKERIQFMLEDSEAKLLIADRSLVHIADSFTGDIIYTDEIPSMQKTDITLPRAKAEDLFILLYTSGSTGVPKGCMLEYGNITAFTRWFRRYYEADSNMKYAAYASFGFDASMMDTYGTLANGGELHIIPEEIRLDLMAIDDYFGKNGITHAFMTTQVGRQFAMSVTPKGLKHLSVGGEKLVPCEPPEGFNFYNIYGPTECTIIVTAFKTDKYYSNIPIGYALDNTKLYVCDNKGHMLPPGACGELMITGHQVSRGYLKRPEKTAEVYTKNPFNTEPGYEKMYHTGDVVRFLDDGNIQIVGRRDAQVKIRGFRIELTEVEEVIRRFDGITNATVAAFDEPSGGKYIAAYVVSDGEVDIDALNNFILAEKPPYMVPAVTMQIDEIPMTQNHKVNKRALPVPERKVEEIIPPKTDAQKRIFELVAEVVGHDMFGITTSIYMAGLTSIGAVRLNVLLSKEFNRPVKTRDLKENDTVEKLEKLLTQSEEAESFELRDSYPITKTQEGIFVECIAHPSSAIYNIPMLLKISPDLDIDKLKSAVEAAVNAHPYVLGELIMDDSGDIAITRNPDVHYDKSEIICEEYATVCDMMKTLVKPFGLLESRLFRIYMIRAEGDTYLYLEFHHIISDGTSLLILLDEISRAYRGEVPETESYSGYEAALSESKQRNTDVYEKAKAYYDSIFEGCDAECLPYGDLKGETPKNAVINKYADTLTSADAKEYCKKSKVTANGLFSAAFGLTLAKYTNKEQAVFTTIYNGRSDSRLDRSVSMYVKTFPVMAGTDDCMVCDYVKGIGDQLENSMANDIYSFAEISRSYGINADVMFAYQGEDFGFSELCEKPCTLIDVNLDEIKAPLNINVFIEGERIRFFCEYRSDRFSDRYINAFLTAYEAAILSMLSCERISEVSLLTDASRDALIKLNSTEGTSYTSYISLPKRLDAVIAKNSDKTAVTAGGKSITFAELGYRANSVGNGLVKMGVERDEPVALMLHRTIDVYPVRQGILRSGGAFLSIEPDYPDERITYILEDAGVRILITTPEVYNERKQLLDSCDVSVVTVDTLYKYSGDTSPDIDIEPEQLAYCIYTSGSTGKPKGVMIEHRNLLNFIDKHDKNIIAHYYDDYTTTMLALAAITFDVSVLEEFMPLYHGKSVAMATEEEIHNPILLAKMMQETGVDVMKCTPSYIQTILDVPPVREAFSKLKAICIGAEPFPSGLYTRMRESGISGKIYNSYGPSETTVSVTIDDMCDERISIGKPVGNTKVWILDSFGNILPEYVPGELAIAGASVGRGYMGLADMTADKFITIDGLRAYKSGDIALWNGDGKIECKGRKDNQVKLRGLRVELDEIEKVMNMYEGITRSVVLVKENESGQYLCGYYTGKCELDADSIASFMQTKLTAYMIPGVFMYMEKLPMTKNGKVDKRALPEPSVETELREGAEPQTELEELFCDMFAKALGISKVYADDDFFALGGTSLSASKIAMNCMIKQLPVAYATVFEHTTPRKLAAFVKASEGTVTDETAQVSDTNDGVLAHNRPEYLSELKHEPIGNVLLSGATGFLGIHVLRELINGNSERIYCLVRKGDMESAEKRLKTILMYYFDDIFESEFVSGRINAIEADITDDNLDEKLSAYEFDTVINCAAIVKHFAVGDLIERVNVGGVKNLISLCKSRDIKLIQVSTVSVAGESVNGSVPKDKVITESDLYFGQSLENRYVNTKFHAEEEMLKAISEGMRGKIIRVGNLMSRKEDGEFQINYLTNGFMSRLRAYAALESFPVGSSDAEVEFSPIDYVARAVVLLSGTNDSFTVYHAYNCHHIHMANVIDAMNEFGIHIDVVADDKYTEHFGELLNDESMNMKISSLISYNSADGGEHRFVGSDNSFTIKTLYRLGFSWPLIDETYLKRAIESLSTLDFFDE